MSSFDINIDDGSSRTMKTDWSADLQVDGFLILSDNCETLARSIELLDSRTQELDQTIKVPNNPDIYILHIYGLHTEDSVRGKYKQVLCYAKMRIRAGITNTKLHMKLTKYTEDYLPIELEQRGTLPVSVEKKPPSEYKVVINAPESFTTQVQFFVMAAYDDSLSICCVDGTSLALSLPFDLPPATWVVCQVFCRCQQTSVTRSDPFKFETFLTTSENNKLYDLALQFNKPIGLREITYFYRNKKRQYFDEIMNDMNGVMIPKPKNNGGEQGSVVNGNFRGLFFSTYIDIRTNWPQQYSFFGPTRFNVQAEVLFTRNCSLYFVDFYCHYRKHHMAVILTPKSSCHNSFCQKYLYQLDIYNNPFLKLCKKGDSWVVMANMDMIVEVYYTETVNINSILQNRLGYIEDIAVVGRGYVLPQGIPKRASCQLCNL